MTVFDDLFLHPPTRPVDLDWIDAYREQRTTVYFQRVVEVIEEPPEPPPTPHSIQQEALETLKSTREAGNEAGLFVPATGLAKTWLAAFDLASEDFRRLLFVADWEEILTQAMQTFRRIRPRARLGLHTGKEKSPDADVLPASIQTLSRMYHLDHFAREQFEVVEQQARLMQEKRLRVEARCLTFLPRGQYILFGRL